MRYKEFSEKPDQKEMDEAAEKWAESYNQFHFDEIASQGQDARVS